MSIVSSIVIENIIQIDGRRFVRERHTDQLGATYDVVYYGPANDDPSVILAARVATIEDSLDASELGENMQRALDQKPPTFNYTTAAKFRQKLRELFQTLSGWDLTRLGKFVNSLNLSDAVLKALFGVNDAQLVVLKAKLSALASKYDDVIAQVGQ